MDNIKDLLAGIAGNDEIKEKIGEVVKKLGENKGLLEEFKADPKKAMQNASGIDIPDDLVEKVISGVKGVIGGGKDLKDIDLKDLDLGDILGKAKDILGDK